MKRTCPKIHHLLFTDDSIFFMTTDERNARAFQTTLEIYSDALGQKMNWDKSCIQFGATTSEVTKSIVKETMGIEMVENAGKYLELPTNWGRWKRDGLGYLKERIIKKLHGWKSLFLNNAGKDIIINAIISTIPTYDMTLFRLPKTWCEDIEKLISKFWWNGHNERKKIHWVRWNRLTMPKNMRGLGFRDMIDFNTAMLTNSLEITKWKKYNMV